MQCFEKPASLIELADDETRQSNIRSLKTESMMRTTFTRCTTSLAVLMALSACDAEGLFEDIGASLADGEEINVEASTSTGEEVDISIAADDDGGIDVDVVISGDTDGDGGPTDPEPPEPITPEPPEPITPEPPEPENVSPTADFSSPANGAQIVAGSPVFVSVVAADSDGVIDNVAFLSMEPSSAKSSCPNMNGMMTYCRVCQSVHMSLPLLQRITMVRRQR